LQPTPQQQIQFCSAPDGTRIAIAQLGSGPPLVRASHWLSHVEYDLDSPIWRPWLLALSRHHRYIRYDQRGCGLSDREVTQFGLDDWVSDLETVVDHLALDRFPLFGMSQGGAIAIRYALRHPHRVSHLVLMGAYARGMMCRAASDAERLEADTLVRLIRLGWGRDNPAFRQVFTNLFIPGGTPEQHRWWNDLERLSASPEAAARTLEAFHHMDVTEEARRLRVPTLVLHARGDARVPFDEGRQLAALIPGARFVPLNSPNHVLLADEPAWPRFLAELTEFLAQPGMAPGTTLPMNAPTSSASAGPAAAAPRDALAELTPAERAVLELLARGLDNHEIAAQLGKREKTVRNQLSTILDKLGLHTRAQAIVYLRDRPTEP